VIRRNSSKEAQGHAGSPWPERSVTKSETNHSYTSPSFSDESAPHTRRLINHSMYLEYKFQLLPRREAFNFIAPVSALTPLRYTDVSSK
jgi:hypothetical protein